MLTLLVENRHYVIQKLDEKSVKEKVSVTDANMQHFEKENVISGSLPEKD